MKYSSVIRCALIGGLALSIPLMAQTTTTPTFLQAVSTGMVGLSLNQTAQLNVVNLNPVAGTPAATATTCTVELQFFDGSNNMPKQAVINNVLPGTAASLTLARTEAPNLSVPRFAVRGVVRTSPVSPTAGANAPIVLAGCAVKTTLEIYNNDTGNTQLVTSDVQLVSGYAIPLATVER
jgi:hypothetical protein